MKNAAAAAADKQNRAHLPAMLAIGITAFVDFLDYDVGS
jgi:hypothetical protein